MQVRLRKTLFGKLLLVVLSFCLIMTVICIYLMRTLHGSYHDEIFHLVHSDTARQLAEEHFSPETFSTSDVDLDRLMEPIVAFNKDLDAYLLDEDGRILAASRETDGLSRKVVNLEPIDLFIQGATEVPLYGADPSQAAGNQVFSAARITNPDFPARYLYLVPNHSELPSSFGRVQQSYFVSETMLTLLLSGLLAVMATIVVMRILTRDLGHLEAVMSDFRSSGFASLPSKLRGASRNGDEIERLTAMFLEQAKMLQIQMQDLRNSDETRRDILANVSHDLRTPIATLLLHLETLALGGGMSDNERSQYFDTCINQCKNLAKLVEQLLVVARLDAGQIPFEPEQFNISELMQDVTQKHQLSASKSKIELCLIADEKVPLTFGDIGLIERVFDNLIDNSLQYTKPGGKVTLVAKQKDRKVYVSVADTGVGISEEDQKSVLERFYRTDKSRSQGLGHSGLGLSIANAIAILHGSRLSINSDINRGTRVSFELAIK